MSHPFRTGGFDFISRPLRTGGFDFISRPFRTGGAAFSSPGIPIGLLVATLAKDIAIRLNNGKNRMMYPRTILHLLAKCIAL